MEVIQGKPPGQTVTDWRKSAGVSTWHWQHLTDAERPKLVVIGRSIRILESAPDWWQRMLEMQASAPKRLPGRAGAGRPKRSASNV
jgi:hypothetical protein